MKSYRYNDEASFTIIGVQKTLDIGLSPVVTILMGVVSAVFGGIIRDMLSNVLFF